MNLRGKVAIITGGSRGIGKTIATTYLNAGAKVIIAARTVSGLEATLKELKKVGSKSLIAIPTDVAYIEDVKKLVKQTLSRYKRIDILVNAAGIQDPIGAFIDTSPKRWINNIHVNLIGTMLCCKYVLPNMISQGKGKIINFSGGGATAPRPNFSAYAAAKAAIVRFTETLAEEVKELAIDVNAIAPGAVDTKMIEGIIKAGKKAGQKELEKAIQIKKEGAASGELVAELAVFLASRASDGLTGKLISAVWDKWSDFPKNIKAINKSSLFTLRRIDGVNFIEARK